MTYDPIYKDSQWMHTTAHHRLLETYFRDCPILLNWELHDTQRIIDGRLVFGAWAGPLRCPTHIIHEMCHLVEIDDARILQTGWGLRMPQVYVPGRYSRMAPVPTTYQAALRETRVIALQHQLQNMLGFIISVREELSSLEGLPDWCNVPCGINRDQKFTLEQVNQGRFQFLERYLNECMAGKYTLSFFHQEWERKLQLLRDTQ